ncbi:MAG: hypothetical protein A2474_02845 [Elusimicrobia bacterium RIFOXYC2_FULL_34_12]|nr:MAG: hypothetical protein A2474_02845 [Elusimicrobia bacterium RIFOXYC2_FULL_34_12]OGS38893.1 MAG: hypothetical protein A2551_03465 [Elusimicrobia bacterium RIFOXYD2_FULL_34_30]HAM39007.1 hypothetical protein [Elusimicrobiota bacterium]
MGINFSVVTELFITGIVLGVGPCFLFCAPLISSYIFANGADQKEGLKITISFSLGRILAYSLLGFASVALINTFDIQKDVFKRAAGILLLLILPIYNIGKDKIKVCNFLCKFSEKRLNFNSFFIGLLIGLSPCAPLLAILSYIVVKSESIYFGLFYGFMFGVGTFISPLIFCGLLLGFISNYCSKSKEMFLIFKIIGNVLLIIFALKLIL